MESPFERLSKSPISARGEELKQDKSKTPGYYKNEGVNQQLLGEDIVDKELIRQRGQKAEYTGGGHPAKVIRSNFYGTRK